MTEREFGPVRLRSEGPVAIATISRPEAMNALNENVLAGLAGVVDCVERAGGSCRCLVITGAGEKAFVAGADIKRFEGLDALAARRLAESGQALLSRLEALRAPVVAAVNGFALGGGLELALACDFIYASKNAKLGLPECSLGLMPGYGGTVRLARRIGPARARELAFTGGMIGADQALAIGLVNRVTEQAELLPACQELAGQIASRAPLAVAKIKEAMRAGADLAAEPAMALEARFFGELFETQDQREGVRAFIEKRKPQFKGI
jgi:enoyl-CoA hydratase